MLKNILKNSKRISFLALLLTMIFITNHSVNAAPAHPGKVTVTQPDGSTLTIRLHGDEFFNWITGEDGRPIVEKDGYYYYATYSANGAVRATAQRVGVKGASAFTSRMQYQDMRSLSSQVSRMNRSQMDNSRGSKFPHEGDVKSIVILVEFQDLEFTVANPQVAFTNQLNLPGYSVEGAVGSAVDYFDVCSRGTFNGQFDVVGPYKVSRNLAYYGATAEDGARDVNAREMIREAAILASADGANFAQYDLNNDGYVDNVFVYFAGYGQNIGGVSSDAIWPHKWDLGDNPLTVDGKTLFGYACAAELRSSTGGKISGVGTFIHEFSHVFGLSDHYDTNGGYDLEGNVQTQSRGLGKYDIMTEGNMNNEGNVPPLMNALEMQTIGWIVPKEFTVGETITLEPIEKGVAYKINTDVEGEYFLIENRSKKSNVWDKSIPHDGLLITHVDKSAPMLERWKNNMPNADFSHECFKFVVAGNVPIGNLSWQEVPYPARLTGNNQFTPYSAPRALSWGNKFLPFQITDIARDGVNIQFSVLPSVVRSLFGKVTNPTTGLPIIGAEVTLSSTEIVSKQGLGAYRLAGEQPLTAITDDKGNYFFDGVADGEYTVMATADSYVQFVRNVNVKRGSIFNFIMSTVAQSEMHTVGLHNGNYGASIGNYEKFRPFIIIEADKLVKHVGRRIEQFKFFATAPLEAQVIITNLKTGESRGQTENIVVTSDLLGWRTVDVSSFGMYIEDGASFEVAFMIIVGEETGSIAVDNDTSLQYHKLSNGVVFEGGITSNLYDLIGVKGNFMFDLLLGKTSTIPAPTKLTPESATLDIPLNQKVKLSWKSIPVNANKNCTWHSSNEKIVKINAHGEILSVSKGSATVTGTSILAESVTLEVDVTVTNSQVAKATGSVRVYPGNTPIPDIEIVFTALPPSLSRSMASFTKEEAIKQLNGELKVNSGSFRLLESPGATHDATTDSEGVYLFDNLMAGYSYSGYVAMDVDKNSEFLPTGFTTPDLKPFDTSKPEESINDLDYFELYRNPVYNHFKFKYFDSPRDMSFSETDDLMTYAIKLPKEDLESRIGHKINFAEVHLGQMRDDLVVAGVMAKVDGRFVLIAASDLLEVKSGATRFQFYTDAIIQPDTDYYITIQGMFQMGVETNKPVREGLGNLVWTGAKFIPISDIADYNGNFLISAYILEKEIEPIARINLSVDPGYVPLVGVPFAIKTDILPGAAIYRELVWTSSNEDIAVVSASGEITFLDDKEVVITATSKTYTDVSADISLKAKLVQGIFGTIITSDEISLPGVVISFYPVTSVIKENNGMQMVSYSRISGVEPLKVTSNERGVYELLDIPVGLYQVEAQASGLNDFYSIVDVKRAMNAFPIVLEKAIESLSKYNTYTPVIGVGETLGRAGAPFTALSRWDPADLIDDVGSKITRIKAFVSGKATMQFVIYVLEDDEFVYRSASLDLGEFMYITTSELAVDEYVTIEANKTYLIGYEMIKYENSVEPGITTFSELRPGKGDCMIIDGELTSIYEEMSIDAGNWVIGYYLQDDDQIKGIDIQVGQINALLSWNPHNYKNFELAYGIKGEEAKTTIKSENDEYDFTSLKEDTEYEVSVSGSLTNEAFVNMFSMEFKTLKRVFETPMILINDFEQVAGDVISLQIVNAKEGDKLEWMYNNLVLPKDKLGLVKGEQTVKCRITRGDKVYIVTRVINVK